MCVCVFERERERERERECKEIMTLEYRSKWSYTGFTVKNNCQKYSYCKIIFQVNVLTYTQRRKKKRKEKRKNEKDSKNEEYIN